MGTNPFERSVTQTLAVLRRQNMVWHEERVEIIPEYVFDELARTAPPWPEGPDAFRSLKIRFGHGHPGVVETHRRHMAAIHRMLGSNLYEGRTRREEEWGHRIDHRLEHLSLHAGDDSHVPVVEWVIIPNLSAPLDFEHATRDDPFLADEGLAVAWLFPQRLRAVRYDHGPRSWYCLQYESNIPIAPDDGWQELMFVRRLDSPKDLELARMIASSHVHTSYAFPTLAQP